MPEPDYQVDDYQAVALSLLPTGPVWPREGVSAVAQAMGALASTFARCGSRALALLEESPAGGSLVEMLPDWEDSLGLPDPCSGPDPTIALRQMHVQARLVYSGGQSVPYFIGYAAALGYTITITEFAPARADLLHADDPVYDPTWAQVWQVNAPQITTGYFSADVSFADEPLAWWGNTQLICALNRIKPAHTVLLYQFGP